MLHEIQINPITQQEYYCGSWQDIRQLCRVLNIGQGKAQKLKPQVVYYYMQQVQQLIDGYLQQYYFVPIRPYNLTMPNGKVKKVFPGRLRVCAQQWAAGLLLKSQFQDLDQNTNQAAESYIQYARKQIHQMTLYNQRIPFQIYKSGWGRTALPGMQPGLPPESLW